jgi:alginate O-acetyltransferase complex protein AlgI
MLFNSIDFAIFLPIVFMMYWGINKNLKVQNFLLIVANAVFYGWWDWRFLCLIFTSITVDYLVGRSLEKEENQKKRRALLWLSILFNLGFLGFFKYYNFFIDNLTTSFSFFGGQISVGVLNIILPVGISFYTFQSLSYTIDVYRGKLKPAKDIIAFSAFVSFFPLLVAGPIERATHLLPQFYVKRSFDYRKAVDGMRQILWGLFKKIVIADYCAEYANDIFNNSASEHFDGSTLVLGAIYFTFQIYCDFSGYSDIAIGTARLFGFDITKNFAFPYFSRDIAEFWRRWHISLSTWFRDYLYIPLGGNRGSKWFKIRNIFIVFIVSGFWHGANWTFIIWGALHATYMLPSLLINKKQQDVSIVVAQNRLVPNFKELVSLLITFGLVVFAWIFFRAENIGHAMSYISGIFSPTLFNIPSWIGAAEVFYMIVIGLFVLIEWIGRENEYAISNIGFVSKRVFRWSFYLILIFSIIVLAGNEQEFIYFQF